MDGGVRYKVDIFSGVNKCEEKGYSQSDIIVDIVLCASRKTEISDPTKLSPIGSYFRYNQISEYASIMGSIEDTRVYMKDVTVRYVVSPTKPMFPYHIPLAFYHDQMETMIKFGQEDARNVVNMGETVNAERLLKEMTNEKKMTFASYKMKIQAMNEEIVKRNLK